MCWYFRHQQWHAFTKMTKTQLDETQPIEKTNTTVWNDPLIVCSNMVKREMAAKEKNEDCRRPRGRWSAALLSCIASSSAASPRFSRSNSSSTAWKPTGDRHVEAAISYCSYAHIFHTCSSTKVCVYNPTVQHDYRILLLCSQSHLAANLYRTTHAPEASDKCQTVAPADVRSSAPSPCYTHLP